MLNDEQHHLLLDKYVETYQIEEMIDKYSLQSSTTRPISEQSKPCVAKAVTSTAESLSRSIWDKPSWIFFVLLKVYKVFSRYTSLKEFQFHWSSVNVIKNFFTPAHKMWELAWNCFMLMSSCVNSSNNSWYKTQFWCHTNW